ncbi:MAG TPA: PVC-type heme-binding CxxCH protein, partial [Planctomycetaceae bacterium]|nr:PVC-type heme-binding CxxCH protein [Planctomycetaceae bacterium]
DGWVYLTSGLTGGKVTSPLRPEQPEITVGRTDLRFHPDTGELQACDGGAQFGLTFDEFGHRFICYNRVHVQHVVLASHWLRRNPHLPFSDTIENCPAEMAPEPLKGHGSSARLFPISQNVTTADSHAGTFTAACGVLVYRGTALPEQYRGGVFACDPTGNLVHFDRLEANGATFRAHRIVPDREVVASRDDWFRPVYLANGPDGALYVCDMYRKTIEHPDYLPAEIRKHTDFVSGKNRGHIYRLVAADANPQELAKRRAQRLDGATTAQLCQALSAVDGWQRDTAQRLLIERNDPAAIPVLSKLVGAQLPASVHALYLLSILGKLDAGELMVALQHPSPRVREVAVELASSQKELLAAVSTRLVE